MRDTESGGIGGDEVVITVVADVDDLVRLSRGGADELLEERLGGLGDAPIIGGGD